MSSESRGRTWAWAVVGLLVFGAVALYVVASSDAPQGEPVREAAAPAARRAAGGTGGSSSWSEGAESPAESARDRAARTHDVARAQADPVAAPPRAGAPSIPRVLLDGGTSASATRIPAARRPPAPRALPRRIGPTTPETSLRRFEALQRVLEDRITTLDEQRARAQHAGDEAEVRRLTMHIERLEAQRPTLQERIGELRREVEASPSDPPQP